MPETRNGLRVVTAPRPPAPRPDPEPVLLDARELATEGPDIPADWPGWDEAAERVTDG